MKPIKIIALLFSVQLFGTVILENVGVDASKVPLFNVSLIEAAHAGRGARHHSGHRTSRGHGRTSVDVNRSGSRGNRSVNVDVDHHHGPRLGAVAVGIAIGTRVASLPRSCTTVLTSGVTYHYCGGVYYRPYYQGTTVVYVVTEAPQRLQVVAIDAGVRVDRRQLQRQYSNPGHASAIFESDQLQRRGAQVQLMNALFVIICFGGTSYINTANGS